MQQIQVNGCLYTYDLTKTGLLTVLDDNRHPMALAETDTSGECIYYSYFDECAANIKEYAGASVDLYTQSPDSVASWLVATHPMH